MLTVLIILYIPIGAISIEVSTEQSYTFPLNEQAQPNMDFSLSSSTIYTNLPKVFVQTQISFHIFLHQSIYQIKYTLNEVSTK